MSARRELARTLIGEAWVMDQRAVVEWAHEKGFVHVAGDLATAQLSPIQRAVCDATVFGTGGLARSAAGTLTTIDPEDQILIDRKLFDQHMNQLLGVEDWTDSEKFRITSDPLVHAMLTVLRQLGAFDKKKGDPGV